jgi:hypothetical protein
MGVAESGNGPFPIGAGELLFFGDIFSKVDEALAPPAIDKAGVQLLHRGEMLH